MAACRSCSTSHLAKSTFFHAEKKKRKREKKERKDPIVSVRHRLDYLRVSAPRCCALRKSTFDTTTKSLVLVLVVMSSPHLQTSSKPNPISEHIEHSTSTTHTRCTRCTTVPCYQRRPAIWEQPRVTFLAPTTTSRPSVSQLGR